MLAAMTQVGYSGARAATDLRFAVVDALGQARWAHLGSAGPAGNLANAVAVEPTQARRSLHRLLQSSVRGVFYFWSYLGLSAALSWENPGGRARRRRIRRTRVKPLRRRQPPRRAEPGQAPEVRLNATATDAGLYQAVEGHEPGGQLQIRNRGGDPRAQSHPAGGRSSAGKRWSSRMKSFGPSR